MPYRPTPMACESMVVYDSHFLFFLYTQLGRIGSQIQQILFAVNESSQAAHSCDEMAQSCQRNASRICECTVMILIRVGRR